jgi:hypothetical protein
MARQLAGELPSQEGSSGLVLSGSKELEPGTRAMLLLAEGLFRLDILASGDTLRVIVRNLSAGALEMEGGAQSDQGANIALGDACAYEPARSSIAFVLGSGHDRVEARVLIGTLRVPHRGTIRITAQAIVHPAPAG